jgi:hypothetical protein
MVGVLHDIVRPMQNIDPDSNFQVSLEQFCTILLDALNDIDSVGATQLVAPTNKRYLASKWLQANAPL